MDKVDDELDPDTAVDELTEQELGILAFERRWWRHAGAKEQAIRDLFGISATRYYQMLNALLDNPAALEHDPVLVKRLRRLRATRARARTPGGAQDLRAGGGVRRGYVDQALQPAGAQQGGVDEVGPVRRADHHHVAQRLDAVQLGQQRRDHPIGGTPVRRLPPYRRERVHLVEEHQRRSGLPGAAEQLPYRPFALADPLRQQFGPLDRQHVGAPRTGDRLDQIRLAAPGRAVEQDPARWLYPEPRERVRVRQRPQHRLGQHLLDRHHVAHVVAAQPTD